MRYLLLIFLFPLMMFGQSQRFVKVGADTINSYLTNTIDFQNQAKFDSAVIFTVGAHTGYVWKSKDTLGTGYWGTGSGTIDTTHFLHAYTPDSIVAFKGLSVDSGLIPVSGQIITSLFSMTNMADANTMALGFNNTDGAGGTLSIQIDNNLVGSSNHDVYYFSDNGENQYVISSDNQNSTANVIPLGSGIVNRAYWSTASYPSDVALGSVLIANTASTITALTSTTGKKILQDSSGVIAWVVNSGSSSSIDTTHFLHWSDTTSYIGTKTNLKNDTLGMAARQIWYLTTTGSSGSSTFSSGILNIPTYTLSGLGGVPTGTTITINGTTSQIKSSAGAQDLSTNRTWTLSFTDSLINAANAATNGFAITAKDVNFSNTSFSQATDTAAVFFNFPNGTGKPQFVMRGATGNTLFKVDTAGTITTALGTGIVISTSGVLSTRASDTVGIAAKIYNDTLGMAARQIYSLTTTGSSGSSTFSLGILNIPTYTAAGLGALVPNDTTIKRLLSVYTFSQDTTNNIIQSVYQLWQDTTNKKLESYSHSALTYAPLASPNFSGTIGLPLTNGLLYANNSSAMAQINNVATGSILASAGTGNNVPTWSVSPTLTGLTLSSLTLNGKITTYNSIATAGAGVPSIVAVFDSTSVQGTITSYGIFTPSATGWYRLDSWAKVTTAAGSTGTLGSLSIAYADGDASVNTTMTNAILTNAGAIATTVSGLGNGSSNTMNFVPMSIYAKSGSAIKFTMTYASTGTAMQYSLHIRLESL